MNDYSQFSNLSCYEEFHLKCEICGFDVIDVLKGMIENINDEGEHYPLVGYNNHHYFLWTNDGKLTLFDKCGNRKETDVKIVHITGQHIPLNIKKCIIPDNCIRISHRAFYERNFFEYIELNDRLEYIDFEAFMLCKNLKTIKNPIKVRNISERAFYCCVSLENIVLLDGIKTIGNMVFSHCISLKEIHIPESVECIMDDVFHGCSKNLNIYVNMKNLKYIGREAFYKCNVIDTSTI